jgi:hypothetical protein
MIETPNPQRRQPQTSVQLDADTTQLLPALSTHIEDAKRETCLAANKKDANQVRALCRAVSRTTRLKAESL